MKESIRAKYLKREYDVLISELKKLTNTGSKFLLEAKNMSDFISNNSLNTDIRTLQKTIDDFNYSKKLMLNMFTNAYYLTVKFFRKYLEKCGKKNIKSDKDIFLICIQKDLIPKDIATKLICISNMLENENKMDVDYTDCIIRYCLDMCILFH